MKKLEHKVTDRPRRSSDNGDLLDKIVRLTIELEAERDKHKKTRIKLQSRENEMHVITQSQSYKLAKILALSKHVAKSGFNHVRALNPKRVRMIRKNRRYVRSVYESREFRDGLDIQPTTDLAVVIHMYYTEMLPFFVDKLNNLAGLKYDLFITIPDSKQQARQDILEQLPKAHVVVVPNCGRDVLPFVGVLKRINGLGYKKVLKLHSKRSPHRDDGKQWRDKIINSLVPDDAKKIKHIYDTLDKESTAIVGPEGEYVSLLVNFSSTGHHLQALVGKVVGAKEARELSSVSDEYGFFAGTMFWSRIDALMPVVDAVTIDSFEPEFGQEDSTLAHALERLFNIIPELNGRDMYEIRNGVATPIDYHTSNIPNWSEVALKD